MLPARSGTIWQFDRFTVLPDQRLLLRAGAPVPLTSKAFDTLLVLIENRHRVVTKDELLRAVWPDVAVEEGNLTQQVFLLRKAFGENATQPRYIVTVPGHGYRFAARLEETSAGPAQTTVRLRDPIPFPTRLVVLGIAGVLAIAVGWGWLARGKADWRNPRPTKVTEGGRVTDVAISPDGRSLAYVENDGDEYSLWVKPRDSDGKKPIVQRQPLVLKSLSFSPDGKDVYFTRGTSGRGRFGLYRIPAGGGPEMFILDDVDSAISFSPNRDQFVFMRGAEPETHIIVAAADATRDRRIATRTYPVMFSAFAPDWSPDGKTVAASIVDGSNGVRSSIVIIPVDGGPDQEFFPSSSHYGRLRWLPDGSGLLTVLLDEPSNHLTGGPIWKIGYPDARPERVTSDLADYDPCCLDIVADGSAVAAIMKSLVSDIWIASTDHLDMATQLTSEHAVVSRHGWLPDNDTMVYRDLRGDLHAVTKASHTFDLRLPDGHRVVGGVSVCGKSGDVVFQAAPGNNIWSVAPNAGGPVRLTRGLFDKNPACTPDGTSVLYASLASSPASLWRVSIEDKKTTRLIPGEGFEALESPKGGMLYYWTWAWEEEPVRTRQGRWVGIPASGSQEPRFEFDVPADATEGVLPVWAPDESGLDYVVTRNGVSNVWRLRRSDGRSVQVTRFSANKIFSFAWSPDGHWLSLASGANRSDVVVLSRQP